jgi:hypothetical protein
MRKRIALLAAVVMLASATIIPTPASGQCGNIRFKMYEDSNYGGHNRFDCYSRPDLRDVEWGPFAWEDFDDMISSVQTITWAYFYDGYNYSSLLVFYGSGSNIAYVGDSLNDRFGSVWNGFTE